MNSLPSVRALRGQPSEYGNQIYISMHIWYIYGIFVRNLPDFFLFYGSLQALANLVPRPGQDTEGRMRQNIAGNEFGSEVRMVGRPQSFGTQYVPGHTLSSSVLLELCGRTTTLWASPAASAITLLSQNVVRHLQKALVLPPQHQHHHHQQQRLLQRQPQGHPNAHQQCLDGHWVAQVLYNG